MLEKDEIYGIIISSFFFFQYKSPYNETKECIVQYKQLF